MKQNSNERGKQKTKTSALILVLAAAGRLIVCLRAHVQNSMGKKFAAVLVGVGIRAVVSSLKRNPLALHSNDGVDAARTRQKKRQICAKHAEKKKRLPGPTDRPKGLLYFD